MKPHLTQAAALVLTSLMGASVQAADLTIDVSIPRIDTAEYHRPYLAIWIQDADRKTIRDVAVWHERDKPDEEGRKWLKDLRQWWRLSGRNQEHPADGVSGATRAAGGHKIEISSDHSSLANLPAGDYQLVVEAAREKGGHELLRLELPWPPAGAATHKAQGKRELGPITLNITP